jgi:hypothetical protein
MKSFKREQRKIGDQARHPIVAALPPPVFDGDVLAFDIPGFRQSLMKIGQICARLVRSPASPAAARALRAATQPLRHRAG